MIIITGGAGFIGSALVWKFNREGHKDIWLVDQHLEGSLKKRNLAKLSYERYFESDEFLEGLDEIVPRGVDALFHLGATTTTTEQDVDLLRRNNFEYSKELAQWALREKVYFSYASSASTYGAGEYGYSDSTRDTLQLRPLNPYGESKLAFDRWIIESGLEDKVVGFRFFNVYGPNEYHKTEMRSLVHKGYEQVTREGKLKLFRSHRRDYIDGEQKRDFIYIKDVVDTIFWFFRHPWIKGIYNLGTGKAQTWNELARALFQACGAEEKIDYIDVPDAIRDQYQYFTEADLTRLKATGCPTNFKPLEDGVADYVKHYLATDDPYL